MDRPRGRATGGRTRGRAAPTGDPSQTAPLSGAWAARGRGNSGGGPPPAGSQPSEPVDKLAQQVKAVALAPTGSPSGEANPSDAGVARGQGDKGGRGANRHTNVPRKEEVHRPAHLTVKQGTKGVKAIFQTNYFRLTSAVDLHLYQYRVDFNPDPDVTVIKKALLKIHKERFGAIFIFDGTVLLTRERFKELSLISERKDGTPVQIKIKHTADMAPGDPHYCHLFNHVLRTCSEVMGLELLRRDYFDPNGKVTLSQYNLEVWPGFKTSFLQCEEEVLLNVDFVSRVIRLDTAYTLLEETRMEGRDKWKDLFFNAVLGTTVTTRFNNKSYRVDDVEFTGNPNSTFEIKSQGKTSKISYRDYYRQKYQIEIKNMDQPLLVSKPSNKDIRQKGAAATPVKLVPELCFLTGVTDRMRANRSLMTALDEHVKLEPGSRIKKMEQGFMKRMTDHKDVKELLKRWNLNLEPTFLSLAGRVIEPENIIVGGGKTVPVDRRTGDFTRGLTGSRAPFLHCVPLQSWAIVFTKRMADSDIKAFSDTILRAAETFRFQISRPHLLPINDDRGGSYAAAIETCVNNKATMVMCILPNDRKDRYDAIKRKCYIQRSIPNQVVLMKNVAKKNMSVATKIAIQMSCKIGGTPWAVSIPLKGTMIVGFDVCHDTTNKLQSHGALVATIDEKFTRYASFVNPHEAHNELSNFMGVNMTKAIVTYRQANEGRIPAKIIFYRDGVGEGNIDYTKDHEVGAISTALAGIYGAPDKVPLTFIIVTKRISTRFFSNGGNPPPGSIVDSVVTRPIWYDFYLVSQSVTRGTATPTSYNVVHDANNLKPDVVQQLSYRLCHTYFNWSGALRVPAPCQYAHKLAFLVAQHLHAPPAEGMNTLLYFL